MTADAPKAVDAWSIFVQSRSAVTSVAYPWRLDYTIAISGLDGEKPVTDHYRASCEPESGSIKLLPISNEQLKASPPVPHGFNFSVSVFLYGEGFTIPVGHPAPYQDLIGLPLIAPTYMFGLRYRQAAYNIKPLGPESTLPVIATVSTENRDYDVTLVGEEPLDGLETYHLRLEPRRRPKDNRLRELWIGTDDYLPRRAIISGNFTTAPLVDVPWTVNFTVVNGVPYVSTETTADTLYLPHRRVVRNAVIAFENIDEPGTSIYHEPLLEPKATESTLFEPHL